MVQKHTLSFTGVILAGGEGRRLGIPKAYLKVNGVRLLDTIIGHLSRIFPHVMVVSGEYDLLQLPSDVEAVKDLYPSLGPIGGLITALKHLKTEWILMTGCDYPMLKPELVRYIAQKAVENPDYDLIIPFVQGHFQVLHASYNRRIEPIVQHRIEEGRFSIKSIIKFTNIKTLVLQEDEIRSIDPQLTSFINLNTPQELEKYNLKMTI